jgi:hypothetical protein
LVTYIIQKFGGILLFSCPETLGGQGIGNMKIHSFKNEQTLLFKKATILPTTAKYFFPYHKEIIKIITNDLLRV